MHNSLRVLVAPASTWAALIGRARWQYALGVQWLLIYLGLLAGKANAREIALSIGLVSDLQISPWLDVLVSALTTALAVIVGNCLFALWGVVALYTIGTRVAFYRCLTWVAHGLIPLSLGMAFSQVLFAIADPQPFSLEHALSMLLHPDSIGLAMYLPNVFPPLSLSWFVVSYIDAFAIWSLWLLLLGTTYYLGLSKKQSAWIGMMLVVSLLVILTGVWQTSEWLVVSLATR